ncbi:hypothetical protein [Rhizocola hellebori]|uniref:hypothetical protein n=1 Tax=Rhizocola hellebori TaxID=1392758 RepID=UPI0019412EC9|nr:hypothetical protein [Rhizocola hellebori]
MTDQPKPTVRIEVVHVVNGTTHNDVLHGSRVSMQMFESCLYVQLTDGFDKDGPLIDVLYRGETAKRRPVFEEDQK